MPTLKQALSFQLQVRHLRLLQCTKLVKVMCSEQAHTDHTHALMIKPISSIKTFILINTSSQHRIHTQIPLATTVNVFKRPQAAIIPHTAVTLILGAEETPSITDLYLHSVEVKHGQSELLRPSIRASMTNYMCADCRFLLDVSNNH